MEIQYNGQWGTVCDDFFTQVDATVVCQQLGYFGTASVAAYLRFGAGAVTQSIWLDNVGCLGTESYLSECPNLGWGTHNCVHSEDVGVICTGDEWHCVHLWCVWFLCGIHTMCMCICVCVCVFMQPYMCVGLCQLLYVHDWFGLCVCGLNLLFMCFHSWNLCSPSEASQWHIYSRSCGGVFEQPVGYHL